MLNNTTITFAGNLAGDPELRFTTSGKPVAEIRVIVNRRTKDEAGKYDDATPTTHNVIVWGTAAENVAESLTKGDRVMVHGRIETETWDDKETGKPRYKDVVQADEVATSLTWATATPVRNTKPTS